MSIRSLLWALESWQYPSPGVSAPRRVAGQWRASAGLDFVVSGLGNATGDQHTGVNQHPAPIMDRREPATGQHPRQTSGQAGPVGK